MFELNVILTDEEADSLRNLIEDNLEDVQEKVDFTEALAYEYPFQLNAQKQELALLESLLNKLFLNELKKND